MVDLIHQAVEKGSEKKREEAGLEDPWESRGSMARAGNKGGRTG